MKLGRVLRERISNDRVRLSGEAVYDTAPEGVRSEWFHFDFPQELEGRLTQSGNPWLVLFLPISVFLGEPLEIPLPVDPVLLEGCLELLEVWHTWTPEFQVIPLKAQSGALAGPGEPRTGTFFSGGVDSLYTLLQNEDKLGNARAEDIDDLITIFGIYTREKEIIEGKKGAAVRARMDAVARKHGKQRLEIHTNLYLTRFMLTNSLRHSYGCALAASVLAIEGFYSRVLIPGSSSYKYLAAAGSHPFTDRLLSTTRTRFIPDGCKLTRDGKINYLVERNHDLSSLQVCSRDVELKNCCACAKCVRTMLTLGALGKLDACELFREKAVDVDKVASIYCSTNSMKRCVENAIADAGQRGLSGIADASRQALLWSAWVDNCRLMLGRLRQGRALLPHDPRLIAQLMGRVAAPGCNPAARAALDRFFAGRADIAESLGRWVGGPGLDAVDRPGALDLHLLEHALISTAICESTLDLQREFPGTELCAPGVRYDSAEWLYRLGLVDGVPAH